MTTTDIGTLHPISLSTMKDQLLSDEPEKKPRSEVMEEIWVKAEMEFERICGESLKDGEIKSFDDVKRKIENTKVSYEEPEDKWEKARNLGLRSLDLLKMLVGAASLAAQFVCDQRSLTTPWLELMKLGTLPIVGIQYYGKCLV